MRHYLIMYRPPRPTFVDDASDEESSAVGRHFEYLKRLQAEGTLDLAGRIDDGRMGIAVVRAVDDNAAVALLAADPAVEAGVFTAELAPFRVALPESMSLT